MLRVLLLLLLFTAFNGVTLEKICVRSGEILALECPADPRPDPGDQDPTVLFSDGSLILLSVSETQQGQYSCGKGKTFELKVYETLPGDCENITLYRMSCFTGDSCTLTCPAAHIPKPSTKVTNRGVTWQRDDSVIGETYDLDFSSVKDSDQGVYSCVRSFEHHGHVYKRTFTVKLDVKPKDIIKNQGIVSPRPNEVVQVDVGSPLVINCTAGLPVNPFLDEVYWIMKNAAVNRNDSLRIYSSNSNDGERMTASLVFKEVSEQDLSTVFTCKLESMAQESIAVNVTLAQKARPSYVTVAVVAVVVPVVLVVAVLISIKYKIHITLFLRDTFRWSYSVSDGRSFDAFVMYYPSEQGSGLTEEDRKTLQDTLEDHFGYSLCLFDRDVLPGGAEAEAVLECVEQSRAVLMVPASPDLSSESALLSAVHEALVERHTRLVFIRNKSTGNQRRVRPEPPAEPPAEPQETLQLLEDLGHRVTWRGSFDLSSFFWKQLRYHLPPVKGYQNITMLPQSV